MARVFDIFGVKRILEQQENSGKRACPSRGFAEAEMTIL
jgi:hypothetical protein